MRKIVILAFTLLLFGCSNRDKTEEDNVKTTVENFYKSINDRNYKTMEMLCSPNMTMVFNQIKTFGDDMVKYKHYRVKQIVINGDKARVSVESEDVFGNHMESLWDLVRINNQWRMDDFNSSVAEDVDEKENDMKNIVPYKNNRQDTNVVEVKTDSI